MAAPSRTRCDADNRAWLSSHREVPSWITAEPSGVTADRIDLHGDVDAVVELIGRGLRQLHELAIPDDATVPCGWEALRSQIDRNVQTGAVDPSNLPEPYGRYGLDRLFEIWTEGGPGGDDEFGLVLCHGRPLISNFMVADGGLVGLLDLGGMIVADRHLDLAIVHRDLQSTFGGESVFRFYESYGADPDLVRLDHYMLGSLLR